MKRSLVALLLLIHVVAATPASGDPVAETVGLVDPETGIWYLQADDGGVAEFYFGNPNDYPFAGDWDCNGVDTPGLYRQSDGYVYLRNTNTQGNADITFFFGNPGDIPIIGDFDNDGCDTVSIYRPSQQRFYIINELGVDGGGLGAADYWFAFGNPGDQPFAGDFDGDGFDEIGLHRATTGLVYYEDALLPNQGGGAADHQFYFGNPGDRFIAGDWNGDDTQSVGIFRPGDSTFYVRYTNTQGNADETFDWGFAEWLPVAGVFGLGPGLPSPPQPPMLELVTDGLVNPIYVTSPPGDGRLFVVERRGTIRVIESGALRPGFFLDLRSGVTYTDGEAGLLSLAFHPDYVTNGLFYVFHSEDLGAGDHSSLILEFEVSADPDVADGATRRQVLAVTQPASNHNGGQIEFGPDGYLYIGIGDGGGSNDQYHHGQNTSSLLGKMLRIDVDSATPYAVPADNPFVGVAGADEIWAMGLRNPWRWTFDDGNLYIADVGQGAREEVNVVTDAAAGVNYGWCRYEGTTSHAINTWCDNPVSGATFPVFEYTHAEGCSITGGRVYRATEIPGLAGTYFYGDYCQGWIRSFRYVGGAVTDQLDWTADFGSFPFRLWSFGSDSAGNVYLVDGNGSIWRIAAG